jgi:hypothetical protein
MAGRNYELRIGDGIVKLMVADNFLSCKYKEGIRYR